MILNWVLTTGQPSLLKSLFKETNLTQEQKISFYLESLLRQHQRFQLLLQEYFLFFSCDA
jgi:hypothetical protein